jgi:hypothetical protein
MRRWRKGCWIAVWRSAASTKHYAWYRDVTSLANVCDAIPFPRTPGKAKN